MIEIEHSEGEQWDDLDERADRLRDLDRVSDKALQAAVDGAGVNFNPDHPASVAWARDGEVVIGSRSISYARLLQLPADEIERVYTEWVNEGRL